MKKILSLAIPAVVLTLPLSVYAQLSGVGGYITAVGQLTTRATAVVAALALLVFFYGLMKFIFKLGGSEDAVKEGKTLMIWGLVALFVMVSVWGIIFVIRAELFSPVSPDFNAPTIPTFKGQI